MKRNERDSSRLECESCQKETKTKGHPISKEKGEFYCYYILHNGDKCRLILKQLRILNYKKKLEIVIIPRSSLATLVDLVARVVGP